MRRIGRLGHMESRCEFPADYFEARSRFRELAQRHTEVDTLPVMAAGSDGKPLTLDAAYFGVEHPSRLLLLTSGVHGVEGYAGSVVQHQLLANPFPLTAGMGALLVHAVNPWGYVHGRRVNENNVDLNRNGPDHFPGPLNPAYARLEPWLSPRTPPTGRYDDFWWGALRALARGGGYRSLKQAVAGGQYEYPHGLFYSGTRRELSLVRLGELLAQHRYASVRDLIHLDIHTGLADGTGSGNYSSTPVRKKTNTGSGRAGSARTASRQGAAMPGMWPVAPCSVMSAPSSRPSAPAAQCLNSVPIRLRVYCARCALRTPGGITVAERWIRRQRGRPGTSCANASGQRTEIGASVF